MRGDRRTGEMKGKERGEREGEGGRGGGGVSNER